MTTRGRSLELSFVDGYADGMLTAEVFNWTGHVLRIPRTRLAEGLKRKEAAQTGVYLLIGEDETGPLAYIGEAEDMARRLSQHARDRDWWNEAVLVTTYGDALHKAHVKYLESRLVKAAALTTSYRLENGNKPSGASLNEAATVNMESFLETLHMVLPAIKVDLFQTGRRVASEQPKAEKAEPTRQEFHLRLQRHGISARAVLENLEIVVLAGSQFRSEWIGGREHNTHYWKLHDQLVQNGLLRLDGNNAILTEDYAFSSPSAAAAVISGRSANGRKEWKTPEGKTYAEWEAEQIERGNQ